MNRCISLYDLLHSSIRFLEAVDKCEEILSNNMSYGIIVRPKYVYSLQGINSPDARIVASEWKSTFGSHIPPITEITKVTNASVLKIPSQRYERWIVPHFIRRKYVDSDEKILRLSFTKSNKPEFEFCYIIGAESPHFANDEELKFIMKYNRIFKDSWFYQGDIKDKDITYTDISFNDIIALGTSTEIEDIWASRNGIINHNTIKNDIIAPINLDKTKSEAERISDKAKCFVYWEDEKTTSWYITNNKDLTQVSNNLDDAIAFSYKEAEKIINSFKGKQYEYFYYDPYDKESIKTAIANVISIVYFNEDSEEDKILEEYYGYYRETIAFIIERFSGTHMEFINKICNYCNFSEFLDCF